MRIEITTGNIRITLNSNKVEYGELGVYGLYVIDTGGDFMLIQYMTDDHNFSVAITDRKYDDVLIKHTYDEIEDDDFFDAFPSPKKWID